MDRRQRPQQQRHEEALTSGGRRGGRGAMSASRRGRFDDRDGPVATVPVVDQAGCTARSCRSCVAVTLADAIALGCCPCAVVSLLGLAFVKAPLAAARRCLRRLRRRRGEVRQKKRVRDVDHGGGAKCRPDADAWRGEARWSETAADGRGAGGAARRSSSCSSGRLDAEKVWMEMYRVGQWGFGRLSVPVAPPHAHVAADGDGGGCTRKDAVLRCES